MDGPGSVAYSERREQEFQEWCRRYGHDPEDLDAMLAYEDQFDPTDEDQTPPVR
jgi:hypothetical protein